MSRGIDRERQVRDHLENDGWFVIRAAGSLGAADLVAIKAGAIQLIEVKSTAGGPYERFGPAARRTLSQAARDAGASAVLAYWPSRGKLRFINEAAWPPVAA